ncbi:MAG: FkbM family methyltransferase [Gemmatimonadales bacterium]|nr:FkbM family methyltransferase [Gemmatimonadales bacterium]
MASVRTVVRLLVPRPVRNWARDPRKSFRWIGDELRHVVGGDRELELRQGWTLRCHPAAYRVFRAAQLADPAQEAEFKEFVKSCRPEMMLYDLGAHFGIFSLAALHFGGADARAIAVEPSKSAARILGIQARLNQASDRLTIVNAAAAETAGWQRMLAVGVLADGYLVPGYDDRPAHEFTTVPAVSIDSLTTSTQTRPTHVKIDVEGSEVAVLKGGRETLTAPPHPIVFLELHNEIARREGRDPTEPLEILSAYGYDNVTVNGSPVSQAELVEPAITRLVATNS